MYKTEWVDVYVTKAIKTRTHTETANEDITTIINPPSIITVTEFSSACKITTAPPFSIETQELIFSSNTTIPTEKNSYQCPIPSLADNTETVTYYITEILEPITVTQSSTSTTTSTVFSTEDPELTTNTTTTTIKSSLPTAAIDDVSTSANDGGDSTFASATETATTAADVTPAPIPAEINDGLFASELFDNFSSNAAATATGPSSSSDPTSSTASDEASPSRALYYLPILIL